MAMIGEPGDSGIERRRRSTGFAITFVVLFFAALAAGGMMAPASAAIVALVAVIALLLPWWLRAGASVGERSPDTARVPQDDILQGVIANLPDPTVLLDADGRVLHFNALARELAPALRTGEPALFALRTPEIVAALRQVVADGTMQRLEYVQRVSPERWMELIVMPLVVRRRDTGGAHYSLLTFRDQTPLRKVEAMRADFVANASHELRTPLAALSGFIDTLLGPARNDEPARERFLLIMQAQANRMARLIDDLLSLSRIELAAHARPQTPVDVVPIIRQVADGLESLARERHVVVMIEAPPDPVVVPGDRDELLRLFENLIENALKYGATGEKVVVSFADGEAADGAPELRVSVRDFGPGIAPQHLPRLTERFYRVDVGESRAQGGTGLGLALVKHILNRHRGRLLIESVPGQGATFTACLPKTD
jgi:two-component system phosphate regulon sensor histidine kinase PhoR